MAKAATSVSIVIFDEYRALVHQFTFVNIWTSTLPKSVKRSQILHQILNDQSISEEEKVNKMKTIVSSMKSQEELVALLSGKDSLGCTPLHLAAYHDSEKCCEFLLTWGAKIDEGNNLCYTPLFYATIGDGLKSARVLLRHGADPKARAFMDTRKTRSWICFHYAQFMKRVDMLMLIFHFHTDVLACTLNVREEKYNTLLFNHDPAVMKRCLLMYRKYCYDTEMKQSGCATCKVRNEYRFHCGNCFVRTYCNRTCQAKDKQHIEKCNDDGFNVSNENLIRQHYAAGIKHVILDFYGREPFPAFVMRTKPNPSVIFIGFGRLMLEELPPFIEKHIKEHPEHKTIIPVWVIMYTTSRKPMKLFIRKSMPDNPDETKSIDKDLFVFALQTAM